MHSKCFNLLVQKVPTYPKSSAVMTINIYFLKHILLVFNHSNFFRHANKE